jgi:glycosyltransferase involved in cell wall biosynthesis
VNLAIVHDYLTQPGGAERVVLRLARLFPDAPVYTSLYDPDGTFPEFRDIDVRTSALQGRVDPDAFRRSALRFPSAFRALDLSAFDVVVVSTSAFAHHIAHPRAVIYCHTPPRFLYWPETYARRGPITLAMRVALAPVRRADVRAARRHGRWLANSAVTAARVHDRYGLEATVVHPPLATEHLPLEPPPMPSVARALVVSRLLPYKRVDVAVDACALAGIGLTVVGEGPERARLIERARGTDTTFLGRVSDLALLDLWAAHSLVLVPGVEDFGYAPVEAAWSGRPTVATAGGGALETVDDGVTGRLVGSDDPSAWAPVVDEVARTTWSPPALRASAQRFAPEHFDAAIRSAVVGSATRGC